MKLFYSLKRKVLAVCLAGMLLMALCMGGISIWTISHLTHDYELQNMNHIVDGKTADMNDELLRSENIVDYATHSVEREITDTRLLRDPAFSRDVARLVDNDFQGAVPGLSLICSYYLYYPSENVSLSGRRIWIRMGTFTDVRAKARAEGLYPATPCLKAFST